MTTNLTASEIKLITRMVRGWAHSRRMSRPDTEDMLQNVCLFCIQQMAKFDARRATRAGHLNRVIHYGILYNRRMRPDYKLARFESDIQELAVRGYKNRGEAEYDDGEVLGMLGHRVEPVDFAARDAAMKEIEACTAALVTDKQKAVFAAVLNAAKEGLEQHEVAKALGCSRQNVNQIVYRVKAAYNKRKQEGRSNV